MLYFNPETLKLQSRDRVFRPVYVLILEQLLVPKILYFLVFAACYKQPLSRSFPDRRIILWDWHLTLKNIYECNKKSYLRRCILSNKIVCFSSMVFFPALIFCLFLLKCSDVHLCSLPLTIFWNIKIRYWKRQNCRSCIFVKS